MKSVVLETELGAHALFLSRPKLLASRIVGDSWIRAFWSKQLEDPGSGEASPPTEPLYGIFSSSGTSVRRLPSFSEYSSRGTGSSWQDAIESPKDRKPGILMHMTALDQTAIVRVLFRSPKGYGDLLVQESSATRFGAQSAFSGCPELASPAPFSIGPRP